MDKNNKEVTALVPMKGRSERVPAKNMRNLGGKPLFFHILESLSNAKLVREIIVDTDSPQIKLLINQNFPQVIILPRPRHLLGDKVSMDPIIEYDIKHIKTKHFLQTHATNPFLKSTTIDNAIRAYFEVLAKGYDSVMAVTRYQARFYNHLKQPINHNPAIMLPSQDMLPLYEDNSNFYIISTETFAKYKNRVGKNPYFIELPKLECVDIDEEQDFYLAEALFDFLNKKE